MGALQEYLIGLASGGTISTAAAFRDYFKKDRFDRLLLLLHDQFSKELGLSRGEFLQWRTDDGLEEALRELLSGEPSDLDLAKLAKLIEPRLVKTESPERPELALRVAAAAKDAVPLTVVEIGESTAFLSNRLDATSGEVIETMRGLFASSEWRERERPGEALLRGPLAHADAQEMVEDAQAKAESDPVGAARTLLEACERLDQANLGVVADSYRERAAELLVKAQEPEEALKLLVEVAATRLDSGSELARLTIHRIGELEIKPPWLDDCLSARQTWPLDPEGFAKTLLEAIRGYRLPDSWIADTGEVLITLERMNDVIALADATADVQLLGTNGYRIQLCLAEAHLERGDPSGDEDWRRLLNWADREAAPVDAGVVWQRRGFQLAIHDRVDEALEAYRRAMDAWNKVVGGDEQVAEAFYCIQAVSLNAGRNPVDYELWPLAAELRGNSDTPVARAEHLEARAMKQRLAGNLREAVFSYSRALLIHRRSGSLQGVMAVKERLGELMTEADEPVEAVRCYLWAGKGKQAKGLARKCDLTKLEEVLELDGSRWQRVAVYAVIGEIGEELSATFVNQAWPHMHHDAGAKPTGWPGPDVSVAARKAVCAVSLKLDPKHRSEAKRLMREELSRSYVDNMQSAGRALMLGTDLGLWDESEVLVDAFLKDSATSGVNVGWVSYRATVNKRIAERLRDAALDDSYIALRALASAEWPGKGADFITADQRLVDLCNRHVAAGEDLFSVHRTTREGHPGEVSVGIGTNLSNLGLLGVFVDPPVRSELVERLLAVVRSQDEPETHRATAVDAMHNLGHVLDQNAAFELLKELRPYAEGDYPKSPWDHNQNHPFSAVRISFHRPGVLRGSALSCIARLVESHANLAEDWQGGLVSTALTDGEYSVLAGGLEAARRIPDSSRLSLIEPHFRHTRAEIRASALRAWARSGDMLPPIAMGLVDDSAPLVRMTLAEVMEELPETQLDDILQPLLEDADPMIRFKAQELASADH